MERLRARRWATAASRPWRAAGRLDWTRPSGEHRVSFTERPTRHRFGPHDMTITVLLFAQARERVGAARRSLALPEGSRASDALAALEREHPALATLWPHLAVAVDRRLVRPDAP